MAQSSYGNPGGEAIQKYQKYSQELQELNNSRSLLQKFLAVLFNADAKEGLRIENWRKGALGELEIGHLLDRISAENDFVVLHDRAIPRSQANIDHIVITPAGIFVIDAKNYTGLVKIDEGSLLDPNATRTLYVGNRKQMSLVHGSKKKPIFQCSSSLLKLMESS